MSKLLFRSLLVIGTAVFMLSACAHTKATPKTESTTVRGTTLMGGSISISASTDTTHLVEGQPDYSRYTTPAVCERSMLHIQARLQRQIVQDTGRYDPMFDSVPVAAMNAARQCMERFTVENVDSAQLFYFIRLSLAIQNDAQAAAAIERQLSLASDTAKKGMVLFQAIQHYLDAKPMRSSEADMIMARLDSLGNEARIAQLQAHHALLTRYALSFFIPIMEREASEMIRVSQTMTASELDQWGSLLAAPYLHRASLAAFYSGPDSAIQILQQGSEALSRIRGGQLRNALRGALQTATIQKQLSEQPLQLLTGSYYSQKNKTPFWEQRPAPGKVSLLISVNHNCGEFCYRSYAVIKRLHEEFAARGLDITLVARTMGFSVNSSVQTPSEEIESIRKYFLEDRKLPVTLLMQETPFTTRPDGQRIGGETQFDQAYARAGAVLVGMSGVVRWTGWVDPGSEAVLRTYIEIMMTGR